MLSHGDFETEQEFLEYCAGREIWNRRHKLTPSAIRDGGTTTWAAWFKARFGRTLDEAAREWRAMLEDE